MLTVPKSSTRSQETSVVIRWLALVLSAVAALLLVFQPTPENDIWKLVTDLIKIIYYMITFFFAVTAIESIVRPDYHGKKKKWKSFVETFGVAPGGIDAFPAITETLERLRQRTQNSLQKEYLISASDVKSPQTASTELFNAYWAALNLADDWGYKLFGNAPEV